METLYFRVVLWRNNFLFLGSLGVKYFKIGAVERPPREHLYVSVPRRGSDISDRSSRNLERYLTVSTKRCAA